MTTEHILPDNDPDKDDAFYFESDHLALKGNQDYKTLLKTIVILQAQRSKALEDLDELMAYHEKALQDPISFVARFQSGDVPNFPTAQKIAELPCIDWSKYNVNLPDNKSRPQTRHGNIPQMQTKSETDNGKVILN